MGLYDQTGALVASYEYDAFGRIIQQSSEDYSDDNPFRFSTKYTDDETGLVWYGHRYYEPELGRFINRDPIEEDGGLNLYGFVGNDPVNFYDYLGMILWIPRSYNPEDQPTHKNEEPDPDILDDELRDEAEGRARAIAMERAGGLLSWIVQGAPVTYLDRLEGLYEAAFDRVENEFARYHDEINRVQSKTRAYYATEELAEDDLTEVDRLAILAVNGIFSGTLDVSHIKSASGKPYNAQMLKIHSKVFEWGGAIYRYNGKLFLSNAVRGTLNSVDWEEIVDPANFEHFGGKILEKDTYQILALWHIHPSGGPSSGPTIGNYQFAGDVGFVKNKGLTLYTGRGIDFVDRVNPSGEHQVSNVAREGRRWTDDTWHRFKRWLSK